MRPKIPFNKFPQTGRDASRRRVTKEAPGLRDIGIGRRHVAWDGRECVDSRLLPKHYLNLGNHLAEFGGFAFSEVEDIERRTIIPDRREYPLDDVFNVGKIAAGSPIAVDLYRFAAMN